MNGRIVRDMNKHADEERIQPDTRANGVLEWVKAIDGRIDALTKQLDDQVAPVRKSAFKRFPVLFGLLVTFGVSSILFGLERILSGYRLLNDHPLFVLFFGIMILAITGRLYKHLG